MSRRIYVGIENLNHFSYFINLKEEAEAICSVQLERFPVMILGMQSNHTDRCKRLKSFSQHIENTYIHLIIKWIISVEITTKLKLIK